MPTRRPPCRPGFSLVEAAVATALIGTLAVALLGTLGRIGVTRQRTADAIVAGALADQLMQEILLLPFEDPVTPATTLGPSAGETGRALYNDVDDYHGFVESTIATRDGSARAGLTGWARSVWVERLDDTGKVTSAVTATLKRITVTVRRGSTTLCTLAAIRGKGWDYAYAYPAGVSAADVTSASVAGGAYTVLVE